MADPTFKAWDEKERERLNALKKEVEVQEARLETEIAEPEIKKIPKSAKSKALIAALCFFVRRMLGLKGIHMDIWVLAQSVSIEFHGYSHLSEDELWILSRASAQGEPTDGRPSIDISVASCPYHLDCMRLVIDVYFSENDWKAFQE